MKAKRSSAVDSMYADELNDGTKASAKPIDQDLFAQAVMKEHS